MSRTITAMFDSRAEADAARTRLSEANIDADNVRIIDKTTSSSGSTGGSEDGGFFSSLKEMFLPDEDSHAYGEGINRGGYLLCAEVDEEQADRAINLLDESDSIDFDERQEQWRSEGWGGFAGRTDTGAFSGAGMGASGQGAAFGAAGGGTGSSFEGDTFQRDTFQGERANTVQEERIPVIEEELRIGKREVHRGGARVRSYIREIPVHEQVSLREEHVSVERRPVNETLSSDELNSGDMLRERTVEMTETAEEAVVGKQARVAEELVVRKTSEEHLEQIDDTVRRTELDVEEGLQSGQDRSALFGSGGSTGAGTGESTDFERNDFERTDRDKSF